MASMLKRGVLDLIGAARASMADPFLPKKIEEGRPEDIRECIGCNICLASNAVTASIRCTQNPTMAEEWCRGWHPENIRASTSDLRVLVIGAGPAGLKAARAAGTRGYEVALAEANREVGGHLNEFARLPGFVEWLRVRDRRIGQLHTLDQPHVHRRLVELGVDVVLNHNLVSIGPACVQIAGNCGESPYSRDAATVVMVTMRQPNDALDQALTSLSELGGAGAVKSITAVGDCLAPGLLAEAIFSGHKAVQEIDVAVEPSDRSFRVEQVRASSVAKLPFQDRG